MGFEPTTPAFKRVKRIHALDRAATVIGYEKGIVVKYFLTPNNPSVSYVTIL
jgi:hypothetical protein